MIGYLVRFVMIALSSVALVWCVLVGGSLVVTLPLAALNAWMWWQYFDDLAFSVKADRDIDAIVRKLGQYDDDDEKGGEK